MANILILIGLIIIICIFCNKISFKIGVPVLLGFILLGMLFGSDGIFRIPFENFKFAEQFCSIALIFIIFYGGFGTNWKEAKQVAPASLLLSSIGVLCTALLVGLFCRFILNFNILESFLIGAVLSSTDAASVFSILRSKKLNLKYKTASMLELESGSNDPWAYMLTIIILSLMEGTHNPGPIIYLIFAQICWGILFGCLIAWTASWVFRHIKFESSGLDSVFMIAIAILSYALPTALSGNGYLSAYIVGIVLGNQPIGNKKALVHFFDGLTSLAQMVIFFMLGLLAFPSQIPAILLPAAAIAVFLTFIARPITILGILSPFKAKLSQQAIVAWSGLRGATSIVFAIIATVSPAYTKNDVFHIVFCIVLLSIGIQGTLLPILSKKLKMIDNQENVLKTFNDYKKETDILFLRLQLKESHDWNQQLIKDITLPPKTRIVMIFRNTGKIIPKGDTKLETDDILILSAIGYEDDQDILLTEIKIHKNHKLCGQPLSSLAWKKSTAVLIKRGSQSIIPYGSSILHENDILVVASDEH